MSDKYNKKMAEKLMEKIKEKYWTIDFNEMGDKDLYEYLTIKWYESLAKLIFKDQTK